MAQIAWFRSSGEERARFWLRHLQIKRARSGWRIGRVDGTAEYVVHGCDYVTTIFGNTPRRLSELRFDELGVVCEGDMEGTLVWEAAPGAGAVQIDTP